MVAARLMGKLVSHQSLPWFWSDQGDLKLQIAGLRAHDDEHVVLAEPGSSACTVLCIRGDRLAAVETINRPADHMLAAAAGHGRACQLAAGNGAGVPAEVAEPIPASTSTTALSSARLNPAAAAAANSQWALDASGTGNTASRAAWWPRPRPNNRDA